MAPAVTSALRVFVVALVQLNEVTSFLNPWIVTPSPLNDLHPAIPTIAYAVLEPLCTWVYLRWPLQPWVSLLAWSPIRLWSTMLAMDTYVYLHNKAQRRSAAAALAATEKQPLSGLRPSGKPLARKFDIALTLLVPVLITALVNSALLLFAQSLHAPGPYRDGPAQFLAVSALGIYLICRYADYDVQKRTLRAQFRNYFGGSLRGALFCLPLLFVVRVCVRSLVGLRPFMAFQMPNAIEAEQTFGLEQYEWIGRMQPDFTKSKTFVLICTVLSCICLLGANYCMNRGFEEGLKEDSD